MAAGRHKAARLSGRLSGRIAGRKTGRLCLRRLGAGVLAFGLVHSVATFSAFMSAPMSAIAQEAETAIPADAPSEADILAWADAGYAAAKAEDWDQAYALLARANDATYGAEHYSTLVHHYPNLAFARYYYLREEWDDLARFATSVASALDAPEHVSHPYRIEASTLAAIALYEQGHRSEAEVQLRRALVDSANRQDTYDSGQLAFYYLALVATQLDSADAGELLSRFFDSWNPQGPVTNQQAVHLVYFNLDLQRRKGVSAEALLPESEELLSLSERLEGVNDLHKSHYRGHHALLLSNAGRHAEALPILRERHAFLQGRDKFDNDYYANALRLAGALSHEEGLEAAYAQLQQDLTLGRANGIGDAAVAGLLYNMGRAKNYLGEDVLSQQHLRDAYQEARKSLRENDSFVQRIRREIRLEDPGMEGFAFAVELGALDQVDFVLNADGSDVLRLFFEGHHAAIGPLLDRAALRDGADPSAVALNRALYAAFTGRVDQVVEAVDEGRAVVGGAVAPDAALFQVAELIARVWGSADDPDSAELPLLNLRGRLEDLPPDQASAVAALWAFRHSQAGQQVQTRLALRNWFKRYEARDPARALTVWDFYAAGIALEMVFADGRPEQGEQLYAETLVALEAYPDLRLAKDYVQLAYLLNAPNALFDDDALAQLGRLILSISEKVPEDSSMVAAAQFSMGNALGWRGQHEEALEWMRRATKSWRKHPNHRRDTLAFLMAAQVDLLLWMGRNSEAAGLAREAYDIINVRRHRPDLAAGVIVTYANAIWSRSENPQRGVDILEPHLADAVFMEALSPADKIKLLTQQAMMAGNAGHKELSDQLFAEALAAIPEDETDWRATRSRIQLNRAIDLYRGGELAWAYQQMTQSNAVYQDWRNDIMTGEGGAQIDAANLRARAEWAALIGWDYAQSLPE